MYGIRTNRYKLIHVYDDIDEWELYDLQQDPYEMNNIYNNPENQNLIKELKYKLQKMRVEIEEDDSQYPEIQKIIEEHWND